MNETKGDASVAPLGDGGPAFPNVRDMRFSPDWDCDAGMSLRDYFAAKAMQGLAAGSRQVLGDDQTTSIYVHGASTARIAYDIADAMLAERAKGGAA